MAIVTEDRKRKREGKKEGGREGGRLGRGERERERVGAIDWGYVLSFSSSA